MTVRTLSGATVTLVGRGANYFDGDAIIPSFVDADGTQYFIINDPDDLTLLPAIIDGLLTVYANASPAFTVAPANAILVNDPTTVENSTSALVFAKRCGIDVSLDEILVFDSDSGANITLTNDAPRCADGVFALSSSGDKVAAYVESYWGYDSGAYIGCDFEPVPSAEPDFTARYASQPNEEHNSNVSLRRSAHNAWVFMLAGVPRSVFGEE